MTLVIDQHDALAKAILPQRRRELKARMPRADDHNRSMGHRNSPTGSAQGIPMSSLSSPILVLARLTLSDGARGRSPKDGAFLASRPETAHASPNPEVNGQSLADFAGIVT